MSMAVLIRRMSDAGASLEAIALAVEAIEAETPKLTLRQARNRRYYEKKRLKASEIKTPDRLKASEIKTVKTLSDAFKTLSDGVETPSLDKETPPHPLKKLNSSPPSLRSELVSAREADDWPSDFRQRFWDRYPRKVAKAKALRTLETVRRSGSVTFAALMAALDRYVAAGLDPQFVKHPATWINGGCWDDDPAALVRAGPQPVQPRTMFEQKQQELKDVRSELRAYIDRTSNNSGGAGAGVLPGDPGERSEDVSGRSDRVVGLLPATNIRALR